MRLLYPSDPFKAGNPDETYADEHTAVVVAGMAVSLFSFEDFSMGRFRPRPAFTPGEQVCYRGWMLSIKDYQRLWESIQTAEAAPLTSPQEYELCHYMPKWYPLLVHHTPNTLFFSETDDIATALHSQGWTGCFLKDYVKSLSTDGGSLVTSLETIPDVIRKMKKYRGLIEGGLCARQIEDFVPSTERRHFVLRGQAHSLSASVPGLVSLAAQIIKSPFFTVDTIEKQDGTVRIVELGDGQVSDLKRWPADQFVNILQASN